MAPHRNWEFLQGHVAVEALETRRLFTAELLASRTLEITGTDLADDITVDRDPRSTVYVVSDNGNQSTFPVSQVSRIIVNALGGNDVVRIGLGGFSGSIRIAATIDGGDGDDLLTGDLGNDHIIGGAGNDTMAGFGGNDVIDCGAGDDTVTCNRGIDTVTGGSGNDSISAEVSARHLVADGGAGDDVLTGSSRNDVLVGGDGNDTIDGVRGKDKIDAGAGNDIIILNFPRPKVTGGPGADTFRIPSQFAASIGKFVLDYTPGEDVID